MTLLLLASFLAGVLTVLAPCVFPFLPVIIGGSVDSKRKIRPFVIALSLIITIVVFSIALTGLAEVFDLSLRTRRLFSVVLLLIIGIFTIFPELWEKFTYKTGITKYSQVSQESQKGKLINEILVGVSLGPAFAACSPVYTVILTIVLPQSFSKGLLYMTSYAFGLGFIMLMMSLFGDVLVRKFKWSTNPRGKLRRLLGVAFVLVAAMLYFNWDYKISEIALSNETYYNFTEGLVLEENEIRKDIIDSL